MNRKVFTLASLFCLLAIGLSVYAAGPDGFAGVWWGAGKSQVDQAMEGSQGSSRRETPLTITS